MFDNLRGGDRTLVAVASKNEATRSQLARVYIDLASLGISLYGNSTTPCFCYATESFKADTKKLH